MTGFQLFQWVDYEFKFFKKKRISKNNLRSIVLTHKNFTKEDTCICQMSVFLLCPAEQSTVGQYDIISYYMALITEIRIKNSAVKSEELKYRANVNQLKVYSEGMVLRNRRRNSCSTKKRKLFFFLI